MSVIAPVCLRVAVLWHDTLIAEATVDPRAPVTVGEDPHNTLVVPGLAGIGARHRLFDPGPDGPTLMLTDAMRGRHCAAGEEPRPLAGGEVVVAHGDWGLVELSATLSIFYQAVDAPDRVPPAAPFGAMESSVLGALFTALVAHLAVLVAAFLWWQPSPAFASFDRIDRPWVAIFDPPPPPIEPDTVSEEPVAEVSKAAGGESGTVGAPDAIEETRVPKRDGALTDRIRDAGVHKALGSDLLGRGPLANVFGDKTGFGEKLTAAMAGSGDVFVAGAGAGGLGLRGTGNGGDGQGFGRVKGMGRIDTGHGGAPRSRLAQRTQEPARVKVTSRPPSLAGFCKESDITRVVGARRNGISFCYERALAQAPELAGKITVTWRILLDGKVGGVMVEASTLGAREVEDCVARQVRRWTFPPPEGGMCQVRFPFVFSPGQ